MNMSNETYREKVSKSLSLFKFCTEQRGILSEEEFFIMWKENEKYFNSELKKETNLAAFYAMYAFFESMIKYQKNQEDKKEYIVH